MGVNEFQKKRREKTYKSDVNYKPADPRSCINLKMKDSIPGLVFPKLLKMSNRGNFRSTSWRKQT